MLDNREPEAEPRLAARARRVGLTERLEHRRQEIGRNADAGVADGDFHRARVAAKGEEERAAIRRELHGVREQVAKHLREPAAIRVDVQPVPGREIQCDATLVGQLSHVIQFLS